jgi:hypothetical protein
VAWTIKESHHYFSTFTPLYPIPTTGGRRLGSAKAMDHKCRKLTCFGLATPWPFVSNDSLFVRMTSLTTVDSQTFVSNTDNRRTRFGSAKAVNHDCGQPSNLLVECGHGNSAVPGQPHFDAFVSNTGNTDNRRTRVRFNQIDGSRLWTA